MLHMLLLCAVVLASGLVLTTSTLQADDGVAADVPLAAEASYLTRSYAIMRDQMRDGDLQAAAKTLSWIRQVAGDDATVRLLAAELTLRNGRFALAAMQLAELIEAPRTAPHLQDEARLLLDTTALMRTRPVLALTGQLADEAEGSSGNICIDWQQPRMKMAPNDLSGDCGCKISRIQMGLIR